jgi:hypothetical protein
MGLPTFTDIISLSNTEISEAIIETENKLFSLISRKLLVKILSHEIKKCKTSFSSTKTLLTLRLQNLEQKTKI